MKRRSPLRLHFFFATENDRAVIIRHGYKKESRMILWHRDTDQFEDGQWLMKSNVEYGRCELSPDGRHLIYVAHGDRLRRGQHGNALTRNGYTVISQPPYWTALALFPHGLRRRGGEFFFDNRHFFVDANVDIIERETDFSRVDSGEATEACPTGLRLTDGGCAPMSTQALQRVMGKPGPVTWSELRHRLPLFPRPMLAAYATEGGKLFRRVDDELQLIRDLTDMEFERVRAPYDFSDDPDADAATVVGRPKAGGLA